MNGPLVIWRFDVRDGIASSGRRSSRKSTATQRS